MVQSDSGCPGQPMGPWHPAVSQRRRRGESVAYLRQLGALDESDPEAEGMPQVMATLCHFQWDKDH